MDILVLFTIEIAQLFVMRNISQIRQQKCLATLHSHDQPENPVDSKPPSVQRLCMTILLLAVALATFVAVLSYLAGDREAIQ